MAQLDQFKGDYEKAVETKDRIQGEFQKRKTAEAAQQSTAKFDSCLRGQLAQMNVQLQGLEHIIIQGESSGLLLKEKERRKTMVLELRELYNQMNNNIQEAIKNAKTSSAGLFSAKPTRTVEGESDDVKDKATKDLHLQSQEMLKKQDESLGDLQGIAKNIKYVHQAIGEEADTHSKLLDEAGVVTDRTTANMIVVDSKLKGLIKQSNTCCLWVVIVIELVLTGLLVISIVL